MEGLRSRGGFVVVHSLTLILWWKFVVFFSVMGLWGGGTCMGLIIPTANSTFQWVADPWGGCVHKDPGACCSCYSLRNVTCVFKETGLEIPSFYCRKLLGPKPPVREPCPRCQQDCVLSTWGKWSGCSRTCAPATRHRIRNVLLLPFDEGDKCRPLKETKPCGEESVSCEFVDPRPEYYWVTGNWTGCRKVREDAECGEGYKSREVYCSSRQGELKVDIYCQHHQKDVEKPINRENCTIPCPCVMEAWSPWGPCSRTCHKGGGEFRGYQTRSRNIIQGEETGGVGCPAKRESRECDIYLMARCDRYTWHTTDWSECHREGSRGPADCGPGFQTRQVFCIKEGDASHRPEEDIDCVQDAWLFENTTHLLKPNGKKACHVPCPVDCQLGEWQNWSGCTKSCGSGGNRSRMKPVLVSPSPGGAACGTRIETKRCEGRTPCMWWHKGRWTVCSLEDKTADCGVGSIDRNLYCLNSMDEVLPDENCTANVGKKPRERDRCHIPCADDCSVSEWSEWGECSATCGAQGGVQRRDRQILYQKKSGRPCMPDKELRQFKVCNQRVCRLSLWQVTAWTPCLRMDNTTTLCGEGTGVQYRTVQCEQEPGYKVNETLCSVDEKPEMERVCSAPCPVHCQLGDWSDWSQCSENCASESKKYKYRSVHQVALHGGLRCPAQSGPSGIIIRQRRCQKMLSCYTYMWVAGDWGSCVTTGGCGLGVHTRNVTCMRSDHKPASDVNCFERGAGEPPSTSGRCYFPCKGDCLESPWSDYTPCSHSCGSTTGIRYRTKRIINLDPSLPAEMQCPHVTAETLNDTVECGRDPCPAFHWQVGHWGSCIVHQVTNTGEHCGSGIKRRHVICVRDNTTHVPSHHCDSVATMPDKHLPCVIHCSVDCEHSEWSEWSNCSHPCDMGTIVRTRSVIRDYNYGGRQCPELEQTNVCMLRDCEELQWHVSQWGECMPSYNLPCGRGRQSRTVSCPAGEEFEDECEKREPRPTGTLSCEKPCFGDCLLSEWSVFSPCVCASSIKYRTREVLRAPLPSGLQCGDVNKTYTCECPKYRLEVGNFTSCIMQRGNREQCGTGVRSRTINCIRESDGIRVSIKNCDSTDIMLEESCEIPCPVDCEVGDFNDWSPCSEKCGIHAMKSRRRKILQKSNSYGRQCPSHENLNQVTICHTTLCYQYHWDRGPWTRCSMEQGGCGVGIRTRTIKCKRSDRAYVDEKHCFSKEDNIKTPELKSLSITEQARLDLGMEESCGYPCPGDCVMSEWSDFSPCFRNCSVRGHKGSQVRTREVLEVDSGGLPCPSKRVDVRKCPDKEAICPLFYWKTTNWTLGEDKKPKRKIFCAMHEETKVMGGCLKEQRPSRHRDCETQCSIYAKCVDGVCICDQGFSGDGQQCLPDFGCVTSAHCVINGTYCDEPTKECLCGDGSIPYRGTYCSSFNQEPPRANKNSGLNRLFIYVLIACLCALLLLAIVATVCLIRRRRKDKDPKRNNLTPTTPGLNKIDNLDANPKNNEIYSEDASLAKCATISSSSSSSNNHSKNLNERSQNSLYHSKFSSAEDSTSSASSPRSRNRVNAVPPDGFLVQGKDNTLPRRAPESPRQRISPDEPVLLLRQPLPPQQLFPKPWQQEQEMPPPPPPPPKPFSDQLVNNGDGPMFGSVASRNPAGRAPPATPERQMQNRNPSHSPEPPGYQPRPPPPVTLISRRPSNSSNEGPKLTTFKPESSPEPLPDPGLWQPNSDEEAPEEISYRPRIFPIDHRVPDSAAPNPVPVPLPRQQPQANSRSPPPPTQRPHSAQNGAPPARRAVKPPGQQQGRKHPQNSSDKKDSTAAQNLLQYCDTLIADLERVAKS